MTKKYAKCHRGYFKPRNPDKYVGDLNKIEYKSGLELTAFRLFDKHSSIIKWSVESVQIPYRFRGKYHHYIVDIWAIMKLRDGSIEERLVEIKHSKEVKKPTYKKRKTKTYLENVERWERNMTKWDYAKQYAKGKNMKFMVLTEQKLNTMKV